MLASLPLYSSQYAFDFAALSRSIARASHVGICTPTNPRSGAHAAIESSALNGGLSPMYWARKMAGPLMVFMSAPRRVRPGQLRDRCVALVRLPSLLRIASLERLQVIDERRELPAV